MLDGLYEFRLAYGTEPETWRDFQYGLGALSRAAARDQLKTHDAVASTKYVEQDRVRWRADKIDAGGL